MTNYDRTITPWASLPDPNLVPQFKGEWVAKSYTAADIVVGVDGKSYISYGNTTAQDVPGQSGLWKEFIGGSGGVTTGGNSTASFDEALHSYSFSINNVEMLPKYIPVDFPAGLEFSHMTTEVFDSNGMLDNTSTLAFELTNGVSIFSKWVSSYDRPQLNLYNSRTNTTFNRLIVSVNPEGYPGEFKDYTVNITFFVRQLAYVPQTDKPPIMGEAELISSPPGAPPPSPPMDSGGGS